MKKLVLIVAIGLFSVVATNAQSLKDEQAKTEVKAKASVSLTQDADSKENKKDCDTKKVSLSSDKEKSCATKKSCASKRRPTSCKD